MSYHKKTQSCKIRYWYYRIPLKFDMCLGSYAAEAHVKFQSDQTILNLYLIATDNSWDLVVRNLAICWIKKQEIYKCRADLAYPQPFLCWNIMENDEKVSAFDIITRYWLGVGSWISSSRYINTHLFYKINIMTADVLAVWGAPHIARTSAVMDWPGPSH